MEDEAPLPLEPIKSNNVEDRRLWVGNLDLRMNEYQLLKIVQKHGIIEKFDLLFHRSGPQAGLPRGYAFVTYKTVKDAEKALESLQNLKVGCKNMVVRYAHSINEADLDKKLKIEIPALAGAKKNDVKISRETAIQAIEAKLKLMKESEEEFQLNKPPDKTPIVHQYQKPENNKSTASSTRHFHRGNSRNYHNRKPYHRGRSRR